MLPLLILNVLSYFSTQQSDTTIFNALKEEYGGGIFQEDFGPGEHVYAMDEVSTCSSDINSSTLDHCSVDEDWVEYNRIWTAYYRSNWRETALGVSGEEKLATMRASG